jgi:hypothetical protein
MTLTEELEGHPIFIEIIREAVRQLKYGVWTGGSEADPEGFVRDLSGRLVYDG